MPKSKLQEYLEQDRQWTRPCRIANARYQFENAVQADKQFWRDVLAANGAEVNNEAPAKE
jgi:hypothetical protein